MAEFSVLSKLILLFICQVKRDYGSGKSRGFGFVHFKDPEVEKTVLAQVHKIQGRTCEVRLPRCKVSNKFNVLDNVEWHSH